MENLKVSLDKVIAALGETIYTANMTDGIPDAELKKIITQLNHCSHVVSELQAKLEEG